MKIIRLTYQQELDLELALKTRCANGLDADAAAYAFYIETNGPVPPNKLLARLCEQDECVNPEHIVLVNKP